MRTATPTFRTALLAPIVCALAACTDAAPLVGPAGPGPRALDRRVAATTVEVLVSGLEGAFGSTIGPGGALFVTEAWTGRILRVDLRTGATTTFATGLPPSTLGGVQDVVFIGSTAYAMVTLVGPDVGGSDVVGIYRIDDVDSHTIVADLGAFALAHPPETEFFVPTGAHYALEVFRGGLLVSDGHHNRVLHVSLPDGTVSEFRAFGNIVPTGMEVRGNDVFMAEAGPLPHAPATGRVVVFGPGSGPVTEVASGYRLIVDVESGPGGTLFALSQGVWDGVEAGSPALPNTGALLRVNADGTFTVLVDELDRPTSLEIVKDTAYVVTLAGEVLRITNIATPPFGPR